MKKENKHKIQLQDTFGRNISYLRVSLTEQCNLKCDYCYGTRSMDSDSDHSLSDDNLIRVINIFARLGIDKIRFTGGEPLIRKNIASLISKTSAIHNIELIGLTTNGVLLEKLFDKMIIAGLNRLNISLDTLNRAKYKKITGKDRLQTVLNGINLALKSKAFERIKANTVVMRGINDEELAEFARWALDRNIDLRFIEFMPTAGSGWGRERFVGENEMRKIINLPLKTENISDASRGPAQSYTLENRPGRISFISAVSRTFCNNCNRLRLTSSGDIIGCLFGNQKINIKHMIQDSVDDTEIELYIRRIISQPEFRRQSETSSVSFIHPSMRRVGG